VKRRESEEEREREGREVSVSVRLSMSSVRLSVCPIHCYAVCARTGTSASCSSGVCVFFILIRQVAAPVLTAYPFTQLIELIKKLLELFCSQSNSFLMRCDEIDFILFLFFLLLLLLTCHSLNTLNRLANRYITVSCKIVQALKVTQYIFNIYSNFLIARVGLLSQLQ